MTPERKQRLCLLWQQIEHGLFWPASQSDQRRWCSCFTSSLADLWGVDPPVVGAPFPKATFPLPVPGFAIEYDLSYWTGDSPRASLRFMFQGLEVAAHHIDHAFEDRNSLYDPPTGNALARYPRAASRQEDLLADICWVLDRFVFHPCAHVHPSSDFVNFLTPIDNAISECLHEVRFGLGTSNPFAALFQFRVNMLLRQTSHETKAAKLTERNRVAALMRDAILGGGPTPGVAAGVLFDRTR